MFIQNIRAREIIDSRGNPTVEVKVMLKNGLAASASVPSGASTGVHEALELRDGDAKRYRGKGVLKAVKNVNDKIIKVLKGKDVSKQKEIDRIMIALDGTPNKAKLGANAILGVSLACARTAAMAKKTPLYTYLRAQSKLPLKKFALPTPTFNIFNGGQHADTNLSVQELMVIPVGMKKFREKVRAGYEIFHSLGAVIASQHLSTNIGNEGGYAPQVQSTEHAIQMIVAAIKRSGYVPGKNVFLGTDMGASELFDPNKKTYTFESDQLTVTNAEMIALLKTWVKKYPFLSIEDPLEQDEWEAWQACTQTLGAKTILVGDDLFVTNIARLKKGIEMGVANAVLIKVNQIGTLSETLDCIALAKKHNYKTIISHRSGETTDDFIADISVAVNADFVKMGSSRGERVCKYNRLMEIEDEVS